MKTAFVKTIALVAMLVAGSATSNLRAEDDRYVVNYETVNEQVVSKTVYLNDGGLQPYLKYNFAYNKDGKVSEQEVLKWDSHKQQWAPNYKQSYTYTDHGYTIEHAAWNPKAKEYNLEKMKNEYPNEALETPVS